MQTVHVLIITHRHGVNVSVHSSVTKANETLYNYVQREWDYEIRTPFPGPDDDPVGIYFDVVEHEYYDIETCEIDGKAY